MKRRVVDPSLWSDTPRAIVVDLSSVRTFDDFVRAMMVAFPLEEDPLEIWVAIRDGLFWQTSPLEVRFDGWSQFEKVMPGYARKLKRLFRDHRGRVTVEYRDAEGLSNREDPLQVSGDIVNTRPSGTKPR